MEGQYPNTTQLIPDSASTTVEIDAHSLLRSIERASLLSHEGHNNVVRLVVDPASNTATIFGNSPEIGNVEEVLDFNQIEGDKLEISFSSD
ncbi:hypothetical protein [Campylobacter sp. 2018MI27]|uniref:hypothetical protein n=1 Tax=Campylobacter sp. 2018MI27 TaxID=2836738 RepID=UPI001BD9FF55|nr:hypothetical protein [Campylobacter sp. 2018MI27]MBT0881664.1 hypothetical protein [Campylobacter sp. 2018MI27]